MSTRQWAFTLFTNDGKLAQTADLAGVDRIGPDLEFIGKKERQKGIESRLSNHSLDDAPRIFREVSSAARFARINPLHEGTGHEVEALLADGAEVLMFPFFQTAEEVRSLGDIVRSRAMIVGLVETRAALKAIKDIQATEVFDEIHFGLTDLGIDLGTDRFGVLQSNLFLDTVEVVRQTNVAFGIAGFADPEDSSLPFNPGEFCKQAHSLGATRAIVSRSFVNSCGGDTNMFVKRMKNLRRFLRGLDR